jgi:hypothetical protein
MSRWPVGEFAVEGMIERREIEVVQASVEHANLLMHQADGHLDSADPLTRTHPPSAFALLYDGARKAMTAVLARQGLRATRAGGHVAVQEAIEAQLGPNAKVVVRPFRTLRRRRNESEYPNLGDPTVTQLEAIEGLEDARAIAEAMKKLLPRVGPWNPRSSPP